MPYEEYKRLQNNLLLFYTGQTRNTGDILSEQKKNTSDDRKKIENIHKLATLARTLKEVLLHNNIDAVGEVLDQGWRYKKELASGISNKRIDECYETAKQNGACGGKLLGAGGGGFLLFYVKEENHKRVRRALNQLKELTFSFENKGVSTIYYNKQSWKQ